MNYENYDPCFPDHPVVDQYLPMWADLPAFRAKPAFIWAENGSTDVTESSILTYEQLNKSVQSISSKLLLPLQRGDTKRTIAVVAEMQRSEGKIEVLRRLIEGIRKAVIEEEKVEVGMVVLVKSGNVPRTTSGKIQRWLAKDKLLGGKMNVVLQIKFKDNNHCSKRTKRLLHEGEGNHMGKRMKDNETAGACPSQSHNLVHSTLLSSL